MPRKDDPKLKRLLKERQEADDRLRDMTQRASIVVSGQQTPDPVVLDEETKAEIDRRQAALDRANAALEEYQKRG